MAVQYEIKSQLAKLLATEDLVVEHKHVTSAQFNVHTRVLTLPLWELASNNVYDVLVAHEVGHALYTPDEDWTDKVKVPQQFVNVCEDARIEKLMKRRYMGLAKTFYNGYNELNEQDFFEINDEDITTFNLADRANLYFKIGSFLPLDFSVTEKQIIDLIGSSETFDDTLKAAESLYEYCVAQQEEQKKKVVDIDAHQKETQQEMDFGDVEEEVEEKEESQGESPQSPQMESGSESEPAINYSDEIEVQTAESLEDKIKDLVNSQGVENDYIQLPKVDLDTVIASNVDVHKEIDYVFISQQEKNFTRRRDEYCFLPENLYEEVDYEFYQFKNNAKKEVNYLVKEFECRKAASSYARAATSRTGVLDTAKLHTYRYNEDLFMKITTLPDGKNHGLVFVLDWSGSMQYVLEDTLKQLYNLIWFCRKVNIPFDVYAFTNEWYRKDYTKESVEHYEVKEGMMRVENDFALMNLLTSKVNGKTLEHQMKNMWRLAHCFGNKYSVYYTYPEKLVLSGTPLNESLVALHQILPKFQRENKVEKVQCVVLTDGEANYLPYHKIVTRRWRDGEDETFLGVRNIHPNRSFLRDRQVGKTYKFGHGYHEFTGTLLENLKDKFPSVNFIGIRVIPNKEALRMARMYYSEYSDEYRKIEKDWKRNRSFAIKNGGYHAYFIMSSSTLAQDAEFDVDEGATKAKIKSAFVKSLKTKKLNKKVLGEFISLVA